MPSLRQNVTWFWRNNDVINTSCVRWDQYHLHVQIGSAPSMPNRLWAFWKDMSLIFNDLPLLTCRGWMMHICKWTGSSLVQVITWSMWCAKAWPDQWRSFFLSILPTSVKSESKYNNFNTRKQIWKCYLQYGCHFVSGLNVTKKENTILTPITSIHTSFRQGHNIALLTQLGPHFPVPVTWSVHGIHQLQCFPFHTVTRDAYQ